MVTVFWFLKYLGKKGIISIQYNDSRARILPGTNDPTIAKSSERGAPRLLGAYEIIIGADT
jgi:hypothetical protein